MVIPIMIMVIFAQRAIVSGLTRGRSSRRVDVTALSFTKDVPYNG